MTILKGVNLQKSRLDEPKKKMNPGEKAGALRMIREEFTIAVALADGDTILGPFLPEGARVMDAQIRIDGTLGSGGILDLGHKASADGSIAEDLNSFISDADAGGQAVLKKPIASNVGIDKKFDKEVQLVLDCTEASSVTSGVKISFQIAYVIN